MAKINVYQRELYHHGILGQKWGRRQGPPYPLDAGDHSALEKKEGYKKSIGGGRNESLYDRKEKEASSNKTESKVVMRRKGSDAKSYDKFNNSKEAKAAEKSAYNKTIEWFKKKDHEYLDKIIKENGGSTKGLEKFEDFQTIFDYHHLTEWDNAEKQYNKVKDKLKDTYKDAKKKAKNAADWTKTQRDEFVRGWQEGIQEAMAEMQMQQVNEINRHQQQQIQNQIDNQQFINQAIIDANRTASLGLTAGMNPFLFG